MAFSTQKDIFYVPFMNERPQEKCITLEGVKLKTYASTTDERAWSLSKEKQSQYLIDLVACRMYSNESSDAGDGHVPNAPVKSTRSATISKEPEMSDRNRSDNSNDNLSAAVGDDSLINTAIKEITKFEELLAEKDDLQSQLEVSQEKLNVFKEEKETIDAILDNSHYPEMASLLERKIKHLKTSSKIDKNDEYEFLQILNEQHNREKAYKVLDAQNSYLRRLVEKLSLRSRLSNISVDPETSTDINYLQSELNNLRKEVYLLRSFDKNNLQQGKASKGTQGKSVLTDRDEENVAQITAERNELQKKCQHFASIQGKIIERNNYAAQLQSYRFTLKKKDEEIEDCHDKIEELHNKFEKMDKSFKMKYQTLCASIDCLEEENWHLKKKMCNYNCEIKQIPALQNQIQCLRNELCEKKCIIDQYDMQFQQLLGVVDDLQKKASVDIRSLQDVDSQTQNEQIEELAATTRATLDQISKELETRENLESELAQNKTELENVRRESQEKLAATSADLNVKELENHELKECIEKTSLAVRESYHQLALETPKGEDCPAQVERLKELIMNLKSQHESEMHIKGTRAEKSQSEVDSITKSLTLVQDEKRQLEKQNQELNKALAICHNQLKAQNDQLSKLDVKTNYLASELRSSKADLEEVGKLVTNISSVQQRNESLKSVVEAVDFSEISENEVLYIKRQLEEEKTRSDYLTEQNKQLQRALDQAKDVINSQKAVSGGGSNIDPMKDTTEKAASDNQPDVPTPVSAEAELVRKTATDPLGAALTAPSKQDRSSDKKGYAKLAQLRKMHEVQRKVERTKYEKEIDGHLVSNEVLRNSLTKLTTQMQTRSAAAFEKEFRSILDNFMHEIYMWRCEKHYKKLSKLEELCKKILETGIEHLSYKELVYLHQQLSDAALKLRPKGLSAPNSGREVKCFKCSGDLFHVPMTSKENERILEKLALLERDIKTSRANLRKIKEARENVCSTDTEQTEPETMRSQTYRSNRETTNL